MVYGGCCRTPENIGQALRNVYSEPSQVDADLIARVHEPSLHPQAREVFVSVITGKQSW